MEYLTISDIGRFSKKYNVDKNGCWIWQAGTDTKGYGKFGKSRLGKTIMLAAHRVSYYLMHGSLTPAMTLDHLCRNRLCVNPEHLEEVSQEENLHRSPLVRKHWDSPKITTSIGVCKRGHQMTRYSKRFRCMRCQRKDF